MRGLLTHVDFKSHPVPWRQQTLKEVFHEAAKLARDDLLALCTSAEAKDCILTSITRAHHNQDKKLAELLLSRHSLARRFLSVRGSSVTLHHAEVLERELASLRSGILSAEHTNVSSIRSHEKRRHAQQKKTQLLQ